MFKGYLKTNGKIPITKFDKKTQDPPRSGDYAGLLDDGLIQVDIDDAGESEIVLNIINGLGIVCPILKTTRGLHFYFKNTSVKNKMVGCPSAIGVSIDYALGNKKALVPLRVNGVLREWIVDYRKVDDIPEIPIFLLPIRKNDKVDFKTLGEGDGRNQELFNYVLTLQCRNGFSTSDTKYIIGIINDYVLKVPLSKRELEVILRDEAFPDEIFKNKTRFLHSDFGDYLIKEFNIINIDEQLHFYKDGIYVSDTRQLKREMIKKIRNIKEADRVETLKYIELAARSFSSHQIADERYIATADSILNIHTLETMDFTRNIILKHKLPVSYNPHAYDKTVDKMLDDITCNNRDIRALLEEMIGYCLYRRNEIGASFLLKGDGANGKSTLIQMITALIGEENISYLSLQDLSHNFRPSAICGKLVNLGDDTSNEYIGDTSQFKKLVTGDITTLERKGQDCFSYKNYAKFIFSANEIPKMYDKSLGLKRRVQIIPFNATFNSKKSDFDPQIKDKLTTKNALEYLFLLALDGLKRVLDTKTFTKSKEVQSEIDEFEKMNNPVLSFFDEIGYEGVLHKPVRDVYLKYTTWCAQTGGKPYHINKFSQEVTKHFELKGDNNNRINGKQISIYKPI